MSAPRRPIPVDQEKLLEEERLRLRKIGLSFIGGIVVLIVVGFFVLGGSQKDSPDVLIVFAGSADRIEVDEDDFVRVTGTMRRATDDSRYSDSSTVSLFADTVRLSRSGDAGTGLAKIADLRGNADRLGDRVTVVGKVESASASGNVIAISEP